MTFEYNLIWIQDHIKLQLRLKSIPAPLALCDHVWWHLYSISAIWRIHLLTVVLRQGDYEPSVAIQYVRATYAAPVAMSQSMATAAIKIRDVKGLKWGHEWIIALQSGDSKPNPPLEATFHWTPSNEHETGPNNFCVCVENHLFLSKCPLFLGTDLLDNGMLFSLELIRSMSVLHFEAGQS